MGEYYVVKKRTINNHQFANEHYIVNTEYEELVNWYSSKKREVTGGDEKLDLLATLLAKISVWAINYPNTFNEKSLHSNFSGTKGLEELYYFLHEYNTIEKVKLHFKKLHDLLKVLYPNMP